jgi:hypothetical protein
VPADPSRPPRARVCQAASGARRSSARARSWGWGAWLPAVGSLGRLHPGVGPFGVRSPACPPGLPEPPHGGVLLGAGRAFRPRGALRCTPGRWREDRPSYSFAAESRPGADLSPRVPCYWGPLLSAHGWHQAGEGASSGAGFCGNALTDLA